MPKWDSPEDIVLIVAGGEAGRYSAVLGPVHRHGIADRLPGGAHGLREPVRRARRAAEPLAPRPARSRARASRCSTSRKNRGAEFLDRIETHLQRPAPRRSALAKEIFSKPAEPELIRRIADRGDLAVEGLAD